MTTLNVYIGFSRQAGPSEGACLIFARTAREARPLAFGLISGWYDNDYIDTGVRRLRDKPWLFLEADQEKLGAGIAHAVECPRTCPRCELWGTHPPDAACAEETA